MGSRKLQKLINFNPKKCFLIILRLILKHVLSCIAVINLEVIFARIHQVRLILVFCCLLLSHSLILFFSFFFFHFSFSFFPFLFFCFIFLLCLFSSFSFFSLSPFLSHTLSLPSFLFFFFFHKFFAARAKPPWSYDNGPKRLHLSSSRLSRRKPKWNK